MDELTEVLFTAGVEHFSPSQLNRPVANWMFEYIYLGKERRREIIVGENAAFGSAVHGGIQSVLCNDDDYDTAIDHALMEFDFHPANESPEKREHYRELIEPAIILGCDELLIWERAEAEMRVEWQPEGLAVPIIGYVDMAQPYNGRFLEMKTKAPRLGAVKKDGTRGWNKAPTPKEPEWTHVQQAAVYYKATGLTPHIAYISDHSVTVFNPDNCEKLSEEAIEYAAEQMLNKALKRQNLLKISTDPKVLASILEADFEHPFYWKHQFNSEAKELFGK